MEISLDKLSLNSKGTVSKIINSPIKRRLLDIGLTNGTKVEKIMKNFSNNMCAYDIRNAIIGIRNEDANKVILEVYNYE